MERTGNANQNKAYRAIKRIQIASIAAKIRDTLYVPDTYTKQPGYLQQLTQLNSEFDKHTNFSQQQTAPNIKHNKVYNTENVKHQKLIGEYNKLYKDLTAKIQKLQQENTSSLGPSKPNPPRASL